MDSNEGLNRREQAVLLAARMCFTYPHDELTLVCEDFANMAAVDHDQPLDIVWATYQTRIGADKMRPYVATLVAMRDKHGRQPREVVPHDVGVDVVRITTQMAQEKLGHQVTASDGLDLLLMDMGLVQLLDGSDPFGRDV